MAPPTHPPGARGGPSGPARHFRAQPRRPVRLAVELTGERDVGTRTAWMVDISLAGAGLELDEAAHRVLLPRQRLVVAIAAPTLWDPLQVPAVVTWVRAPDGRTPARAGVVFEHAGPESVFATWEMLSALVFD